jgi:hypothetical protein
MQTREIGKRHGAFFVAMLCLIWASGVDVLLVGRRLVPFRTYSELAVPLGLPVALAILLVLSARWRARISMIVVSVLFAVYCVLALFSVGLLFWPCIGFAVCATGLSYMD